MQIIKEEQLMVACSEQLDVAYQTPIVMKCGQKKFYFPCYLSNIFWFTMYRKGSLDLDSLYVEFDR